MTCSEMPGRDGIQTRRSLERARASNFPSVVSVPTPRHVMDDFARFQACGRRSLRQVEKVSKQAFETVQVPRPEDEREDDREVEVASARLKRKRGSVSEVASKKKANVKTSWDVEDVSSSPQKKAVSASGVEPAASADDGDDTIFVNRFRHDQEETTDDILSKEPAGTNNTSDTYSDGNLTEIDDSGLQELEQAYITVTKPIASEPKISKRRSYRRNAAIEKPQLTGTTTTGRAWKSKVTLKIGASKLQDRLQSIAEADAPRHGRGGQRKARRSAVVDVQPGEIEAFVGDGVEDDYEELADGEEPRESKREHTLKSLKGRKPSVKSPQRVKKAPKTPTRSTAVEKDFGLLTPPDSQIKSPQVELDVQPESNLHQLNHIDPALLALSRKLTARPEIESKPDPAGAPLVWADSRQALCETVPYFKKPQGGCHQKDRHVYSFLYDGVGHCREYMDTDVIISRAGGGMEPDGTTGLMVQRKDQLTTDAQALAVQNDIILQNPLLIISGDRNTCALVKMPHKYCVLGWYKPIDMWQEKSAGKGRKAWTTVKYRFERLDEEETIWHRPANATESEPATVSPLIEQTCSCGKTFSQVYLIDWMCLNTDCEHFWKLTDGTEAPYGVLDYNPAFLQKRTPWQIEEEPFNVRSEPPDIGNSIGDHLTYINTRGISCPKCGRCNSRYMFKGWKCDNPSCDWELCAPTNRPIMPAQLHSPWDSTGDGPPLARNKHANSVTVDVKYLHGYKVYTYKFDGINGSFVHALANNEINGEKYGPNDMLVALQTEDIGLERRRFNQQKHASTGQDAQAANAEDEDNAVKKTELEDGDFMTAFSMNYGMPYKFLALGASRSFNDAPSCVRATRSRLNWAARNFLSTRAEEDSEPVAFNEQLIFAYLEQQKIEYHDDGEKGLGPCIATFSLGGKAKMHMRVKQKHYVGCSKTGILTAERPIPGGIGGPEVDKRRLAAWEELQTIKETNRPLYQKRLKELPRSLGLLDTRRKKADDLVELTLSHGDIVLMDGYEVQKYLEHKVVPEGYLRFALTCRTVLEGHLRPEERPAYEVGEDDYGYDGSREM